MTFYQRQQGVKSFTTSFGGKSYTLRANEEAPPGTPESVIAKARAIGMVVLAAGESPSELTPTIFTPNDSVHSSRIDKRLRDRMAQAREAEAAKSEPREEKKEKVVKPKPARRKRKTPLKKKGKSKRTAKSRKEK